jgi:virginiamycin B lyase
MQRSLAFISGAVMLAVLLAACGKTYAVGTVAPTPTPVQPSITSTYKVPTSSAMPIGIVSSSSAIWFTEESGNKIAQLNESAKITEYTLPNSGSQPYGITFGPDGYIWFTENAGNRVGWFNPSANTFAEKSIPTASAGASATAAGCDDNSVWFTESAAGKIGSLDTTSFTFSEYPFAGSSDPTDITCGPDTGMWFTLQGANQVGEIVNGTVVGPYTVPTAGSGPYAIVSANNKLWFTEHNSGKFEYITTNGQFGTEVSLKSCAAPGDFVQGVDGNFYIFCTGSSPSILQYNPSTGSMRSFALKSTSVPQRGTIGFDNRLYFTDSGLNAIEQFRY